MAHDRMRPCLASIPYIDQRDMGRRLPTKDLDGLLGVLAGHQYRSPGISPNTRPRNRLSAFSASHFRIRRVYDTASRGRIALYADPGIFSGRVMCSYQRRQRSASP